MKYLVTGAAGFIGSRLVSRLIAEKKQVHAFVLPAESIPKGWGKLVKVFRGDIRNPEDVDKAMRGVAVVFHLAAISLDTGPKELHQAVTVEGTRHVMQAAAAHKAKVILASSVTVYGVKIQTDVLDEEIEWGLPAGFYSTHKQKQEKLARELSLSLGVDLVVLRSGNTYGPGGIQWVNAALREIQRGTPPIIGGGNGDNGFVYVENLVDAFMLAAKKPNAVGRVYNIGDGFGLTWKHYFNDLAKIANAPKPKEIPMWLGRMLANIIEPIWYGLRLKGRPPLTYEAFNLVSANFRFPIKRAQKELSYKPRVTYKEAMKEIKRSLGK